jgi:hypothetical protein
MTQRQRARRTLQGLLATKLIPAELVAEASAQAKSASTAAATSAERG